MVVALLFQSVPRTVNGMLGGFGNLSSIDITGSRKFLSSLTEVRLNYISPMKWLACRN